MVCAISGKELDFCIKECMELAVDEWLTIRLIHNGKEYVIDPNEIKGIINKRLI